MNKQKLILQKQYDMALNRVKSAKSDKQFEKALATFAMLKNELIELESLQALK